MVDVFRKWENMEPLPLADITPIRSLLPKNNVYQKEVLVSRSEPVEIPRDQWCEIHDALLPDQYAKTTSVESYFCVCVYTLRRSGMLSIAAQQSLDKTETIEHSSSLRESISQTERLDTTLDASAFGKAGSLMAHVGASFELSTVTEYAEENRRTSTIEIRYEQCESDRDVVFWDVAKVIVLYRRMKEAFGAPSVRMAALDDFYFETYQKTYTYLEAGQDPVLDEASAMRID